MSEQNNTQRLLGPQRLLGLDVGDVRIGVALSDGLGLTAQPMLTITRSSVKHDLKNLARIVRKHSVARIIAGNPLHMSGDASPQSAKTQEFLAALAAESGVPVTLWDERLTSHAANELLDELGYARGPERKRILDQVAAVLILQGYMDAERNRTNTVESAGRADI